MPRSLPTNNRWRALAAWLAFAVFVSLMLVEAGAQGRRGRSQLQPNSGSTSPPQANRKSIASVRNVDTRDGSRVTITSDVPLNDYAAYWSGDRYYVVIPDADLITRDVQSLQDSLRGQGFQDVLIEKKGNDVVISFRMQPGMRARVEQKFNRLDVIFTAPPGVVFSPNTNRNTGGTGATGGTGITGGGQGNTSGGQGNTSGGGTSTTGGTGGGSISGGSTSGGGGTATASNGGGGGTRRGRSRGGSRGSNGYSGGGDRGGGGAPLNIPLPSDVQPTATPSPATSATTTATPTASPTAGEGTAQTTTTPPVSSSPTPEQIAQNEPPITSPPVTTSTETTAPAPATTSNSGFAAVVKENWLPLLIALLVLVAIGLLLASRSRADRSEERETERLQTKKLEPTKTKPASTTGAAIAGAAAGAATAAAVTKESPAKAAPAKEPAKPEEVKGIEPVAPAIGVERIGAEVKNLLEGKDYDKAVIGATNPETRQIVSTEILAALASRNPERQQRAREAFNKHGFFDEATQKLRTSDMPAERISAARALGLTQDHTATPHLVAALEDDDAEVRRASVNALAELRDPSAIGPLNALLEREKNRKVPHSLIRRAIEASATIDIAQTPAAGTPDATATNADKKDKDDEDREVFEI